ncbi:MAG: hypothetical protein RL075_1902 [Pseudomonadota bacterium]
MTISCPACRHENTDTAKFCLKCGAPMAPAAPVAPATPAPVASEPPRAPEVVSSSVQETPFGSVNVNVTVTPRPPPVPPPPPTFAPKPAAAAQATPVPAAKSGGSTGLIIGVVAVAVIAGGAFVFMGKGEAPAPAAAPAQQGAAQAQPLTSKEILNQILGLVRDNRWQDVKPKVNSLKELVQVTKGNRANSEKLTQDGLKMLESNNTAEAIALFEKAIAEDSSYFSPRSLLGRTLSRSGKPDAARLVLVDALVMEPDRGGTWVSAAEMFAEMGKPEESASALKLAIHFSTNREAAMQFLQDKTKFPSDKFWSVVENNRSALNGVPPYKTN